MPNRYIVDQVMDLIEHGLFTNYKAIT